MSDKKILVFIPYYQTNHSSYYTVLANNVFKDYKIRLLAYSENLRPDDNNFRGNLILPKKGENLSSYIIKHLGLFQDADLIVWEEIYHRHISLYLLLIFFGRKSLLTIHNVNKWLNRNTTIISLSSILIKTIISRLNGIIVISPSLRDYIVDNDFYHKEVFYIPFSIGQIQSKKPSLMAENRLRIVVPGTVNNERRDYLSILKGLRNYTNGGAKEPDIDLIFLGKIVKIGPEENHLIQEINHKTNSRVITWNDYVPDKTFQTELSSADFLLGNIKVDYNENKIPEKYGQSKESGIVYLMLKYQKRTFLPNTYACNPLFKDLVISYNDDEMYIKMNFFNMLIKQRPDVDTQRISKSLEHLIKNNQKKLLAINGL